MTLIGVVIGSVLELMFALFSFMMVAFSGGGLANGGASKKQIRIIDLSLYLIPLSCIICAVIAIYLFRTGMTQRGYWVYAVPPGLIVAYFVYIFNIA